jgi:outer membrane protein assembly factor BamB
MDRDPDKGESMLCLDLLTGKERWRYSYETKQRLAGFDGSRMQPSADSNLVFAVDALGNVIAVNRASGARAWSLNLLSDFADHSAPPRGATIASY